MHSKSIENENITHVNGFVDPIRDIETINTELLLADIDSLEKRIPNLEKKERGGDKDATKKLKLITELTDPSLNIYQLFREFHKVIRCRQLYLT